MYKQLLIYVACAIFLVPMMMGCRPAPPLQQEISKVDKREEKNINNDKGQKEKIDKETKNDKELYSFLRTLPPAEPILTNSQLHSDNQQNQNIYPPIASAILNINIETSDEIISRQVASSSIVEVMNFLFLNFGNPLPNVRLTISIMTSNTPHALTVSKSDRRIVHMSPIDFAIHSERMFLVHELFHAFYQSDEWLTKPDSEVEGLATYSQYKYLYQGKSNQDIFNILQEKYPNAMASPLLKTPPHSWQNLHSNERANLYIATALTLFKKNEGEVFDEYMSLRSKYSQLASQSPKKEKEQKKKIRPKAN